MAEALKYDGKKLKLGFFGFPFLASAWRQRYGETPIYRGLRLLQLWEKDRRPNGALELALGCFLDEVPADQVFEVLEFGASKYTWNNWRCGDGFEYSRLIHALFRHLLAVIGTQRGDDAKFRDSETGLPHIAHACCCLMFLHAHEVYGLGYDDWWRKGS